MQASVKLFNRLSRIIIEPCPTIDFAQKVNPIGRVVLEKVGEYSLGGPKPTIILRPKPDTTVLHRGGIEPVHFGVVNPYMTGIPVSAQPVQGFPAVCQLNRSFLPVIRIDLFRSPEFFQGSPAFSGPVDCKGTEVISGVRNQVVGGGKKFSDICIGIGDQTDGIGKENSPTEKEAGLSHRGSAIGKNLTME